MTPTIIDPNNPAIPDIPENYLTVTNTLTSRGPNASTLEMTMGDYSKVAQGQQRYDETKAAGDHLLQAIKKLAEAQAR